MATLQARLAQGEQAAFVEFYDQLARRIGHYLLARLNCREDAEDVVQEVFLRLARHRHRLARIDDLEAYVFRIARNEAARRATVRARRHEQPAPLGGEALFCVRPDDAAAREAADLVAAALGQLNLEQREVVELKALAGLTFRQVAEVTRLPQGTVASRYRAALERLQGFVTRQS